MVSFGDLSILLACFNGFIRYWEKGAPVANDYASFLFKVLRKKGGQQMYERLYALEEITFQLDNALIQEFQEAAIQHSWELFREINSFFVRKSYPKIVIPDSVLDSILPNVVRNAPVWILKQIYFFYSFSIEKIDEELCHLKTKRFEFRRRSILEGYRKRLLAGDSYVAQSQCFL